MMPALLNCRRNVAGEAWGNFPQANRPEGARQRIGEHLPQLRLSPLAGAAMHTLESSQKIASTHSVFQRLPTRLKDRIDRPRVENEYVTYRCSHAALREKYPGLDVKAPRTRDGVARCRGIGCRDRSDSVDVQFNLLGERRCRPGPRRFYCRGWRSRLRNNHDRREFQLPVSVELPESRFGESPFRSGQPLDDWLVNKEQDYRRTEVQGWTHSRNLGACGCADECRRRTQHKDNDGRTFRATSRTRTQAATASCRARCT